MGNTLKIIKGDDHTIFTYAGNMITREFVVYVNGVHFENMMERSAEMDHAVGDKFIHEVKDRIKFLEKILGCKAEWVYFQPSIEPTAQKSETEECWDLVEKLIEVEGGFVTIFCENPKGDVLNDHAVEVTADWTDWNDNLYCGKSKLHALQAADEARIAAYKSREVIADARDETVSNEWVACFDTECPEDLRPGDHIRTFDDPIRIQEINGPCTPHASVGHYLYPVVGEDDINEGILLSNIIGYKRKKQT